MTKEQKPKAPTAFDILNDILLTYDELYERLLEGGFITECPTTMTASALEALRAAVNENIEVYKVYYRAAVSYKLHQDKGKVRAEWLIAMTQKLNIRWILANVPH